MKKCSHNRNAFAVVSGTKNRNAVVSGTKNRNTLAVVSGNKNRNAVAVVKKSAVLMQLPLRLFAPSLP